jgi:Domain of unknown function (DUF4157)
MSAAAQAVRPKLAPAASPEVKLASSAMAPTSTGTPRYMSASVMVGGVHDPEEHEAQHAANVIAAGGSYQVKDPGGRDSLRADSLHTMSGPAAPVQVAAPVLDPGAAGRIKRAVAAPVTDPGGRESLRRADARGGAESAAEPNAGHWVHAARASPAQPLAHSVRSRLEHGLGEPLGGVRVHAGPAAHRAAASIGARAYAEGERITLGPGESEHDLRLMAHEATHVVQSRRQAGAALSRMEASPAPIRRDGLLSSLIPARVLNFLADQANIIPGYRLLTILLGFNPINKAQVDRNAANILRALVDILPGGDLIVRALDQYGVFDRAGAWVEQQINSLGISAGSIRNSVTGFLGSLGAGDFLDPAGAWERGKRIFTEPIDKIKALIGRIADAIVQFVKDAVVKPLANLASQTRGWDLLTAVLKKNPITGETVPRNADTMIGGFMKLIGEEEIWKNMQEANAVPRAWAWFQTAVEGLTGFVNEIPTLFMNALKALKINDLLDVPGAFLRVAGVFGDFIGRFITWAGNTIWTLLEIIIESVAKDVMPYLKKTGAALKSIIKNPLPFMGNLIKAAKLGFQNFAANIGTHLKEGLIDWLTGSLPGVYIPTAFTLLEFGKFALSVLGLSWAQIRGKIVKALGPNGEKIMVALETGFDIVVALVTGGPAAAWDIIKDKLTNLKDTLIDGLKSFVIETIVEKAVPKLISLFIPGAGFISAIASIYGTVMTFVNKLAKIAAAIKAFVDSIVAIAAGEVQGAANKVESTLTGILSLAISFLAGFLNLGNISSKIMAVIEKVRATVDKGLDAGIAWVISKAKALFASLFSGKDKVDERSSAQKSGDLKQGVAEATALLKASKQRPSDVAKRLPEIQKKYSLSALTLVTRTADDGNQKSHIHGAVNPELDGNDVDSDPDSDNIDPQTIWDEVIIGAGDAKGKQTKLNPISASHARQQIISIFSSTNVPAAAGDAALGTIDSLLAAALQETTGDGITNRMASVAGVANQALAQGGTGTVVNAHHVQQVAEHKGTFPRTAARRQPIPAEFKKVIKEWVDQQTKVGIKGLKSKKEELVGLLRQQLFEKANPNLPPPVELVDMIVTTAQTHRSGHSAMARLGKAEAAMEITASAED